MKQTPCEANSSLHSAIQEILCILWSQKVHYRVYGRPTPVPILSQMNPVHTLPLCFSNKTLQP
jgi:hypothetical protein